MSSKNCSQSENVFGVKKRERCHQLGGHTCQFKEPVPQCRVAAVDRFHSTRAIKTDCCHTVKICLSDEFHSVTSAKKV